MKMIIKKSVMIILVDTICKKKINFKMEVEHDNPG